ncbi:erythrocyte membrane protein 1, PfEMP1, putative [Plasmodium reichenowi]|uniref:Erythrocyte membrane protein 1, PfEMP1, putative n=1 Tax=Plasmodium reichenowi TaxID=5854 RepID=A0A2P9D4W4_PLARE|nr:erythrocyte membrane protein 1, PfEMP1, putative [Plasmodium reichenowi]
MARGPHGGGSGKDIDDTSAKHLLDSIGKKVHDKVHDAANHYVSELHGLLKNAKFKVGNIIQSTDAELCKLNHIYHTNVTNGRSNPCYGRQAVRFSNTKGSECYWNRIKGNEKNNEAAACYPFRRLHLCDRNLEEIYPDKITNTNNLLLDVCLAAKYEGESIRTQYDQDKDKYESGLCTALARSFADIGDIIRGKDLFLGHQQRKRKLEENLKKIFKNIYDNLTDGAKTHYSDTDKNYYKLREDWWELNRQQVWNAMICGVEQNAQYFRESSSDKGGTYTKCRCASGDVLTNFDYVPQFLRWFEEWAEDFCRKKKNKLPNVKTNCRGDHDGDKYCSGNAYDCTQTIYKIGKVVMGNGCTNCSVSCRLYEKWIDNQKQEFLKQREKYKKEIQKYTNEESRSDSGGTTKRGASTTNYDGYESKFYEILKGISGGDLDKFLQLLNKEKECQNIDGKGGKIDFAENDDKSNEYKGTFYHSEYCKPCPECGVKLEGGTYKKREQDDPECSKASTYKPPRNIDTTNIKVLFSGEERRDITEKLKDFCDTKNTTYPQDEQWQCYYESAHNNMCKMTNNVGKNNELDKIMTFNEFFNFWVGHVLNDSIDWRTQLTKCLSENKLKKCKKGCKNSCECFKKWIDKKEQEWKEVRKQYDEQNDMGDWNRYDVLEYILEDDFLEDITKAYGDARAIQGIQKMLAKKKKQEEDDNASQKETIIDILLKHEKDEADECLKSHKNDEKCDDDHEEEVYVTNQCSGGGNSSGSSTKYPALVNQIAHQMHDDAHAEAGKRGLSKLEGHIENAKINNGGTKNDLANGEICNIEKKHSKAANPSNNPCHGKGPDRLKIGTEWSNKEDKNKGTHPEAYMPPRREHMCTSNLEKLDVGSVTKNANGHVNDTFLVDVLLAAKSEAEDIINNYKKNKDKEKLDDLEDKKTVCRAMKYSFADIGDIIKGTDLWVDNGGEKKTQENLVEIFKQIKKELEANGIDKYKGDTDGKHTKLRADWWEANRAEVWESMKCAVKNGSFPCKSDHTPYDDYIPQRLRWMTEWAEWYCKYQSQEYDKLFTQCSTCMSGTCTGGSGNDDSVKKCDTCNDACQKYKENIEKWRKQWETIKNKYEKLYANAETTAPFGGTIAYVDDVDKEDKYLVQFLQELQKEYKVTNAAAHVRRETSGKSNTTDVYATAAGYIHQELGTNMGCDIQREFCDKKNGDKQNENYVFRDKPNDHDKACECKGREKSVPKKPVPEVPPDACDIVDQIIQRNNNGTTAIDGCEPKTKGTYPGWDCTRNIKSGEDGACMPPRRQKLCVNNLQILNDETSLEKLRKAFIECAAIETFWLWHKYKDDKKKEKKYGPLSSPEPVDELKQGKIPDDFKRIMYYTFGDYRDLLFGTDIHKNDGNTGKVNENIKNLFNNNNRDKKKSDNSKRIEWWKNYGPDIWKGMVCGLSHAGGADKKILTTTYASPHTIKFSDNKTTLEDFAQTPQFLRWFTEWGDQFCRDRITQLESLKKMCPKDTCKSEETKATCINACKQYQNWLSKWEENYQKQSKKYFEDKKGKKFEKTLAKVDVNASTYAYEYLQKALQKLCGNGNCKCIDGQSNKSSKKTEDAHNAHMPKSLDYPPVEIEDRCTCQSPSKKPEAPPPKVPEAPKAEVDPKVCDTVKTAFEDGSTLQKVCPTKYGKNYGWRCVNPTKTNEGGKSGDTREGEAKIRKARSVDSQTPSAASDSNSSGSICVPPRRRRLYIGGLTRWVKETQLKAQGENGDKQVVSGGTEGDSGGPTESSSSSSTSGLTTSQSPNGDKLLAAFVESAAIETFFLWDRYKKIKEKEEIERKVAEDGLVTVISDVGKKLQKQLEDDGDIDDEFKRQMFYTLGDYRDICIGDENVINTLKASDKDKKIEEIEKKIKAVFSNDTPIPPSLGQANGVKDPKDWWDDNAKHIWDGMLCALTYDTDSGKEGQPPQKIQATDGTDLFTKLKTQYEYSSVKLDQEEAGGDGQMSTGDAPKLTDFVKRPPYFRWLEEWGDEFCRKRKHKLEIIKIDCKVNDEEKKCSGDGLVCTEKVPEKKEIFKSFNCHSCGKHCSSYRRWIGRQKTEFEKQSYAYEQQKMDAQNNSDKKYDNAFVEKLGKEYSSIQSFLGKLKDGPCKKDNDSEDDKKEEDEIQFDKDSQTFKHTDYCGTCSEFKVKCKGNVCNVSGGKTLTCNGGKINAKEIGNGVDSTVLDMRVSDNSGSGNGNGFNDLGECAGAGIFTGIKENKYKCGEYCGVHVCTLKKEDKNGQEKYEHITVKELLKRWLEIFFEDYNRIRTKLKACKENGNGSPCIKGCVDKWIKLKTDEWEKINSTYNEINENKNDDTGNNLTSFLDTLITETDVKKATGCSKKLEEFKRSRHCAVTASSGNANGQKRDVVECLIDKLQNEIKTESCSTPASVDIPAQCQKSPTHVEDEPEEHFEENTVENMRPNICPTPPKVDTVDEGTCEEAESPGTVPKENGAGDDGEKEKKEDSAVPEPEENSGDSSKQPEQTPKDPAQDQTPPPKPPNLPKPPPLDENPFNHPAVIPSLATSTLAWSIGIGFVAMSYWLLKKKTKSSVDMLRVLEIPKDDYGIPTFKSKNRYVPYRSAQYRGKRYIYLEGYSGTDSGYTDHYSDITSSSESEYDEFDINDIYAPHAPKYKTLIEVVLEPSTSGKNTPTSGNTMPTSDTPPPITDEEWNELKKDFISNMLQNEQKDVPNDYTSGNIPTNTNNTTMPHHNVDEKPFIMSIHDRNLYTGKEISYDMTTNSGNNDLYSGENDLYSGENDLYSGENDLYSGENDLYSGENGLYSGENDLYSGIDLINDVLSGNKHIDIYDEMLKRKENELFGTEHHPKRTTTSTHSVAKPTNSDPIMNQLDLFHKWLDRHRDMCEQWNNREELLDKLKEEWNKDNKKHNDENNINKMLNTDVSIQIDMNNPKTTNEFSNMDTYPDKYTVDNINPVDTLNNPNLVENNINPVDSNIPNPTHVQIEMSVKNTQLVEKKYPIADVWDI